MTAIAWKDGILAADSRVTCGSTISDDSNKKIYKHKKYVLAACGSSNVCAWYYAWLKSNFMLSPLHSADECAEAFLVDREGRKLWRVYANGIREEVPVNMPIATGSAWFTVQFLMREYGVDPVSAIKIVSKYDLSINNRVKKVVCWQ